MELPFTDSISHLIASFNFRRAIALISILGILGAAAWTVDYYTDFSRLSRLEKTTALLERLQVLDEKGLSSDLVPVRERLAADLVALTVAPTPAADSQGVSSDFKAWFSRVWRKFFAGALPWFLFSLAAIPGVVKREKNALAGFFALQFLTFFFGTVIATIPPTGFWIADYVLIPWGVLLLIGVVPMSIAMVSAYRKVRESSLQKAIVNNLRMLSAAADQYFLENGKSTVSVVDLVGPEKHKYIKALVTVDGETYGDLVIKQGEPITVVRQTGEPVTYLT